MTTIKLENLLVSGITISPESLKRLQAAFAEVHYFPDPEKPPTKDLWEKVEAWYIRFTGLPKEITSVEQVPKLRLLQLTSAGANLAVQHPVFKSEKGQKQITISSASGIHVYSIPQYIVSQVISLNVSTYIQTYNGRSKAKWTRGQDLDGKPLPPSRTLYGRTAGLLGYGHIGREAARQLKALNVNIIAANSRGVKSDETGYIVPNTGDPDGSIPDTYYSTADPESFKEFLSKSDFLIASLPSTPATRYLLKKEHLDALPDGSFFINVGRGDLVRSEDILAALDEPNGLQAVALDVTDPEPLPDGHPLWTHPRAVITPHTSGEFSAYFDKGADLLLANVEHYRKHGDFFNAIDPVKGY